MSALSLLRDVGFPDVLHANVLEQPVDSLDRSIAELHEAAQRAGPLSAFGRAAASRNGPHVRSGTVSQTKQTVLEGLVGCELHGDVLERILG